MVDVKDIAKGINDISAETIDELRASGVQIGALKERILHMAIVESLIASIYINSRDERLASELTQCFKHLIGQNYTAFNPQAMHNIFIKPNGKIEELAFPGAATDYAMKINGFIQEIVESRQTVATQPLGYVEVVSVQGPEQYGIASDSRQAIDPHWVKQRKRELGVHHHRR